MGRYPSKSLFWIALPIFSLAAQPLPAPAQWLPEGAVFLVHVAQPAAIAELAADLKIPVVQTAGVQGLARLIEALGARAGTDWKGVVRKLAGRGITYAAYPGDTTVLIVDAEDPTALDPVEQLVQLLARAQTGRGFYEESAGVSTWSLDGKQFWGRAGNRLVLTNRRETLKTLFAPRSRGLASTPLYIQAAKAAGDGAAATAYVNMAMWKQHPPLRAALAAAGSPVEFVLNGAVKQALRESSWLAASLRIEGRGLTLRAACDGKLDSAGAGAFTLPGSAGILPNLAVPRQLASLSLWRDLGKFYAARDRLFPEKTSAGILFENFMEIFFTGRDLNEEVFGRFHPEVRLVAARQQYDAALGTPLQQYPAAALVFKADQPEEFGEMLEEAWQKAIGLTNFTRGQQAQQGLILDRASYGGVPFTFGYFSARHEKDRAHLPSRFNMRPALVRVGPYIIFSTTDGLARDLIDAVNREDSRVPRAPSRAHTLLEISSGAEIAALLAANRNEMTRQSVVSSGVKPEEARAKLDFNLGLLRRLETARLSLAAAPEGQQADLELRLR